MGWEDGQLAVRDQYGCLPGRGAVGYHDVAMEIAEVPSAKYLLLLLP
jgi:hypothetical protein